MNKVVELKPIKGRKIGEYESFEKACSECIKVDTPHVCIVQTRTGGMYTQQECKDWLAREEAR